MNFSGLVVEVVGLQPLYMLPNAREGLVDEVIFLLTDGGICEYEILWVEYLTYDSKKE